MTTTQALWLVDHDAGCAWQIDFGNGVYYGISFWNERMYIAARRAPYGSDKDVQDNVILCYDDQLRLERAVKAPTKIRDVHQIFAADGIVYVVSSHDDQIACYDIEKDDWAYWKPFTPYAGMGLDAHHINSIFINGAEILLAGLRPSGWVARFERQTRKLVGRYSLGNDTHNVWLDRGVVHVCSSTDCTIMNEHARSYPLLPRAWTRGYCRHGERRFVGASEALIRADRPFSDCCVLELDQQYGYRGALLLRGFGMLHELRSLDMPDTDSHNGRAFRVKVNNLDQRFSRHHLARSVGRFR